MRATLLTSTVYEGTHAHSHLVQVGEDLSATGSRTTAVAAILRPSKYDDTQQHSNDSVLQPVRIPSTESLPYRRPGVRSTPNPSAWRPAAALAHCFSTPEIEPLRKKRFFSHAVYKQTGAQQRHITLLQLPRTTQGCAIYYDTGHWQTRAPMDIARGEKPDFLCLGFRRILLRNDGSCKRGRLLALTDWMTGFLSARTARATVARSLSVAHLLPEDAGRPAGGHLDLAAGSLSVLRQN